MRGEHARPARGSGDSSPCGPSERPPHGGARRRARPRGRSGHAQEVARVAPPPDGHAVRGRPRGGPRFDGAGHADSFQAGVVTTAGQTDGEAAAAQPGAHVERRDHADRRSDAAASDADRANESAKTQQLQAVDIEVIAQSPPAEPLSVPEIDLNELADPRRGLGRDRGRRRRSRPRPHRRSPSPSRVEAQQPPKLPRAPTAPPTPLPPAAPTQANKPPPPPATPAVPPAVPAILGPRSIRTRRHRRHLSRSCRRRRRPRSRSRRSTRRSKNLRPRAASRGSSTCSTRIIYARCRS